MYAGNVLLSGRDAHIAWLLISKDQPPGERSALLALLTAAMRQRGAGDAPTLGDQAAALASLARPEGDTTSLANSFFASLIKLVHMNGRDGDPPADA